MVSVTFNTFELHYEFFQQMNVQNHSFQLFLGGYDGTNYLRSTELITVNPPSTRYGPTLPKGLFAHCSVIAGDTIFVIVGGGYTKETLIIDVETGKITNGPDMHFARGDHACTTYINDKGENAILVVGDRFTPSSEILKVHGGQLSWTRGLL